MFKRGESFGVMGMSLECVANCLGEPRCFTETDTAVRFGERLGPTKSVRILIGLDIASSEEEDGSQANKRVDLTELSLV